MPAPTKKKSDALPGLGLRVPVSSPEQEEIKRLRQSEQNYIDQINALINDKNNLESLSKNQAEEIKEFRSKHLFTDEQHAAFINQTSELNRYIELEKKMAKWLGANKKAEIEQGRHIGLNIADVMIMYAAKSCPEPGSGSKEN